jgi:hypothetical protein
MFLPNLTILGGNFRLSSRLTSSVPTNFSFGMFVPVLNYILNLFFNASGMGLSPLYYGHFWPIVPAPDER